MFEYVDDSHIRCVECGHGATVSRFVAVAEANQKPSPVALAQFQERMRISEAQMAAAFRGVPFRPYALGWPMVRVSLVRWSRRVGRADHELDGGLQRRPPVGSDAAEVRVETRIGSIGGVDPNVAAKVNAFMFAQRQCITSGFTPACCETTYGGASSPRDGARTDDPTTAWERALMTVDGEAVEFAVLSEGTHWVAQAIINETVVGIHACHWTVELM